MIGIGIDLVRIARFEQALARYGRRFLDRVFTAAEQEQSRRRTSPGRHLAARFAAKEAAFKALRTGWGQEGVSWREVEIAGGGRRASSLVFSGRARDVATRLGITQALVSLTHDGEYAAAFVVATDGR